MGQLGSFSPFRALLDGLGDDLARSREQGMPVWLVMRHEPAEHAQRLMESLGVPWRVDPAAPRCVDRCGHAECGVNAVPVETRRSTRAELAETAASLRADGYLQREIAEALGVSRSYAQQLLDDPDGSKLAARKKTYRQPCPGCGQPMYGIGSAAARHCASCAGEAARTWTPELVIARIQEWAERFGDPPSAEDWGIGRPDWECARPDLCAIFRAEKPYWPNVGTAQARFGSWAEAIEAAGFARPHTGTRRVRDHQMPPPPTASREAPMDAHDATITRDCKAPGCVNEAKWSRGVHAGLCADHARSRPAAPPSQPNGHALARQGLAAAVAELGRLGKQVDAKREKAKKLATQALAAKAEADDSERAFRARARELMGDAAA